MQNTSFFVSFYAFCYLLLMLVGSLTATMFFTLVFRRVMMNVLDYEGRPMLLASVAIGTTATAAALVFVMRLIDVDRSNVPIFIAIVSGVIIAPFLLNKASAPKA